MWSFSFFSELSTSNLRRYKIPQCHKRVFIAGTKNWFHSILENEAMSVLVNTTWGEVDGNFDHVNFINPIEFRDYLG